MNVPIDHPDADTEWNDILRKHGVIPEKPPSPTPMIEEALTEARRLAHENRLEGKDVDELDELEDDEDEDFLNSYRQKRLAEMSAISSAAVYNQVYHLQKPDYSRDVTEESRKAFVFVLLTSSHDSNVESRVMSNIWTNLAAKFGDIKFCQIRANLCIEGYPDRNTPTILVYKDGDIKQQIVTLAQLKGVGTKQEGEFVQGGWVLSITLMELTDVEKLLKDVGAVKINDHRLKRSEDEVELPKSSIRQGNLAARVEDDGDSDWD